MDNQVTRLTFNTREKQAEFNAKAAAILKKVRARYPGLKARFNSENPAPSV